MGKHDKPPNPAESDGHKPDQPIPPESKGGKHGEEKK